ncbi:MAG: peptidoglycan DD-metalloendopeptidase family protein [Clostridia bacterium]|nr:peptidoglycan DD-metalloendopeptidase family protein [Clostridia bacterium]
MFSLVFALSLVISFVFSGARIVYRVKYSGKDIAIVENKKTFDNAKKSVVKMVEGKNVAKVVKTPEYSATLAPTFAVSKESEIVDAIIDNTDEIVLGGVLSVDGEKRLCADKKILDECMEDRLSAFNIEGEQCNSYFLENIKIDTGYYMVDTLSDKKAVSDVLETLNVMTEVFFVTDITVPRGTVTKPDKTMMVGTKKVIHEGADGINRVTKQCIYLNGNLQSESLEDEVQVSEPDDDIVKVGTYIPDLSKYSAEYTGSGLAFPVGSGWSVSAYFGDNRGHKGIDLSAKEGTPIFAAQSGTVTLSQWYYGYGNCVIIDHGNGFTTLYGHCSQLLCTVGQHVSAGDVIALVGSTGDSTGSHLHFEISINGTRIDPAPYLGLG